VNIAIGSAFRNASHFVHRYIAQVRRLQEHAGPDHTVRIIAAEGDSVDDTRLALMRAATDAGLGIEFVECSHGKRWFGSTEEVERLETLSKVGNAIFNGVRETDDVLLYVECDLLWDPHTVGSLIDMAFRRDEGFDVFAPMVMAGEHFYDIWAFRMRGERFGPFAPFARLNAGLTEVDSVGSCLTMRGSVARECRIENDYCLVGWCEGARQRGYRIAVHPGFKVHHP